MRPEIIEQLKQLNTMEVQQGQIIFSEGDDANDTMYFIISGTIGIYKKNPDGEHEIERLSPGSFFGEMALIGNQVRLATAKSIDPVSKVAVLNKAIFLKLCGSNPLFVLNLLKYSVSRLLVAEDKLQKIKEEKKVF